MGYDPGFRTGCKVAVLDSTGKFLEKALYILHYLRMMWMEQKDIKRSYK